jgi:hypothetical protein
MDGKEEEKRVSSFSRGGCALYSASKCWRLISIRHPQVDLHAACSIFFVTELCHERQPRSILTWARCRVLLAPGGIDDNVAACCVHLQSCGTDLPRALKTVSAMLSVSFGWLYSHILQSGARLRTYMRL